MANNNRPARLAQRIKVILAEALQKTVKDDRVENVTITDARVTNDLQQATVYYTVYGDEDTVAAGHAAMTEHRGMLRREMGRGLNIRLVPTLELVPDTVPEAAAHLEDILRAARARHEELAANRDESQYAGEANPYRTSDHHRSGD
ncbi:30S ribosome-binding factor RbfA [Auritidibacter ignavus]|uniref:30S ribosome-binding factor RbfA n=1 Tax=Auritidibacter ignavus TaxID=678932 RepID=UPI0024B936E4|nr:30S ribosome-binding factor RbfA [Auritidibacter ignavus]WHS34534.1 30S ribosome-binding factor RbfA [Auritidibacter ignavus]